MVIYIYGLLRGEAEDGMGLGYDGQVDGLRREMGGDGVGDADAGGALAGVDRLLGLGYPYQHASWNPGLNPTMYTPIAHDYCVAQR